MDRVHADKPQRAPRRGNGSWTIATVRGVPIRVHWTLLLALPYVAVVFVAHVTRRAPAELTAAQAWVVGILLALGLFAGVALHELAHTLVGTRLGGAVRSITLMFLGGVSELSRPPRTARAEVLMAAVGPLASLAIAAVAWAAALAARGVAADALTVFAQVNLVIAIFNLLPAFPLDGGRVLRGALAGPFGLVRATRIAASVGKTMALLLGLLGLLSGNLLLAVIAIFIYFGAAAEADATLLDSLLAGMSAAELADREVTLIPADAPVAEAADRMAATRRRVLLVVEGDRVVGQLSADRVRAVAPGAREAVPVAQVMIATDAAVGPGEPVSAALARMRESGVDRLPIVEGGRLVGVLRRDDVLRAVELRGLRR